MTDRVRKAIEKLEREMEGVDDALAIPRVAGQFMHALILASNARRGLEIGTSYGYSALWAGSAFADNGGELVTIDRDSRKLGAAKSNIASAGLTDTVLFYEGDATDIIGLLKGRFDFVFIDADKENCVRYAELLAPSIDKRGVVLTDNTESHPEQLAAFVEWIRAREDFISSGVSVGNGMELSVRWISPKRSDGVFGF